MFRRDEEAGSYCRQLRSCRHSGGRSEAAQIRDAGLARSACSAIQLVAERVHYDMTAHTAAAPRQDCGREMRRVLKPGGRVLAVDLAKPPGERRGLIGHLHRHGHVTQARIAELLSDAGLTVAESGPVGMRDLQFTLAVRG